MKNIRNVWGNGRKLREETDRLIADVNKRIPAAQVNAE
jgi:cytochrome c556